MVQRDRVQVAKGFDLEAVPSTRFSTIMNNFTWKSPHVAKIRRANRHMPLLQDLAQILPEAYQSSCRTLLECRDLHEFFSRTSLPELPNLDEQVLYRIETLYIFISNNRQ